MILMYHKVFQDALTLWWVEADRFYEQLLELSDKEVVYLDDYDPNNPKHVVITFDGVYQNILQFAAPLLKKFNYPFELFICSDHIGKDNEFDKSEPRAFFANQDDLKRMIDFGGRLQWHSRTHRDFNALKSNEVEFELSIPEEIRALDEKGFSWFAYPYGNFTAESKRKAAQLFKGAVSCNQGHETDKYALNRVAVYNNTSLSDKAITVIVPSFNYGKFLPEAIESVLRQTLKPQKIIISDDGSIDNTFEIGQMYQKMYPGLIEFRRNEKNLGIVNHFNQLLSIVDTEFYCILGADNRFSSNYLEYCYKALLSNDDASIAYTDYWLFGERAEYVFNKLPSSFKGETKAGMFKVCFPEFNDEERNHLITGKYNFIHGSSMFRTKAVKEVGGYKFKTERPEDFDLATRIIKSGWVASKTIRNFLEYRQHSSEQANQKYVLTAEHLFYKKNYKNLLEDYEKLTKTYEEEISRIKSSMSWKVTAPLRRLASILRNGKASIANFFAK